MKPPTKAEAAALSLVPSTLTADESRLLRSYRATAIAWRGETADFANMVSKMYPLVVEPPVTPPKPPRIRLVPSTSKRGKK